MGNLVFILSFIFVWHNFVYASSNNWIEQQNRVFIEDRIQYWGTGADASEEIAMFKAKGMAIKLIGEECGGFFSKEIVIRRQKIVKENYSYRAYVHADIPYVSCNYSKTPMAKNNPDLENSSIVESQKLYSSLLEKQFQKMDEKEIGLFKKEIIEYLNKTNQENTKNLIQLEQRVKTLESEPKTINQTIIQQNYQMTPSESAYKECMDDYQDLMDDAQHAAMKNRIPGNLAEGKAARIYNKAQVKRIKCSALKNKK
jgi:hypothetical protein